MQCQLQAWTAPVYCGLPSTSAVHHNTGNMLAPKSPLPQLDGLHWMLASGLALVSAALSVYIVRGRQLRKQVNNRNTELSRLLLKVGPKLHMGC